MAGYRTVQGEYREEFVEKRSRFIGHAAHVETPEEAAAYIAQKKSEYWDASHNVYAYILREGQLSRYSDDGEPSGTAGVPVLNVLQKSGLTDTVLVVTRYFGGILLGAGGLVRAYSHGAAIAAAGADVAEMQMCSVFAVEADYTQYGRVAKLLPRFEITQRSIDYAEKVTLTLCSLPENRDAFAKELLEVTAGALEPIVLDDEFCRMN